MIRKFSFDYDYENNNLFLYNPKSKSKASIELDDFIIDYDAKNQISAVELLDASNFFKDIKVDDSRITKTMLKEIKDCKVEFIQKNSFMLIKFYLSFNQTELVTPIMVPTINSSSPVLN